MELSSVVRRAFDIIASGISRHVLLDSWLLNNKEVKLPILLEATPDTLYVLETTIHVPEPLESTTWFLKLVLSGNGLFACLNICVILEA